jgi:hypothetical protein
VTAWLENQNVGPPKSLLASIHASLCPRGRKPARTPPPTFLFLPFHFSNSTGSSAGHPTDKKAVEAASLPVKTGSERPEADEELRRNAYPPERQRAVIGCLYGQRETVVNGWFVRVIANSACPLTLHGEFFGIANNLCDLPDFLHYSGPVSRRQLGSRKGRSARRL